MKIKVMVGGVEKELTLGSTIEAADDYTDLFSSPDYDATKGGGIIKVGTTEIAFVKDENTGLVVPFVWEKGKKARMAYEISLSGTKYSFRVANRNVVEVTPAAGSAEATALSDLYTRYSALSDEDKKNLARLQKANSKRMTGASTLYPSYIQEYIPVHKAGGAEGTIIIAPKTPGASTYSAFYVDRKLERESCLIDRSNFASLGAVELDHITLDVTDPKKMDIDLKGGTSLAGAEYVGSGATAIEELNDFETGFGDAYERTRPVVTPVLAGGIDLTTTYGFGKKKTTADACLVVGPHAETTGNKALYRVVGMKYADFNALGLTQDEFLALATRTTVGTAAFTANADGSVTVGTHNFGADFSIVGVKDAVAYKNKAGELSVRCIAHKSKIAQFFLDGWGRHQYHSFKVADSSITSCADLQARVNGLAGGLGNNTVKPPKFLKVKVALKHALVTVGTAIGFGLLTLALVLSGQNAKLQQQYATTTAESAIVLVEEKTQDCLELQEANKEMALLNLANEAQQAKEHGKTLAEACIQGKSAVGKQFADGSFDLRALDSALSEVPQAYVQSAGSLRYDARLLDVTPEEGQTAIVKDGTIVGVMDENGRLVYETGTRYLTQEDVEGAGKTYRYTDDTNIGYLEAIGEWAAKSAIPAGKTVLTVNEDGSTSVVLTYPSEGRDSMVARFGEGAVTAYEEAFTEAVRAAERGQSIGSQGVENKGEFLQSEAVLAAAAKVAGANAGVLAMQQEGEHSYVYIQSSDEKTLHRIEVSGDAKTLASEIEASKGGKQDQVFTSTTEYAKGVYSDMDAEELAGIYGDTYVSLEKTTKNGVTTYTSKVASVGLEGSQTKLTVKDGCSCQVNKSQANDSEAAIIAVDGIYAAFDNMTNYTVIYSTESVSYSMNPTESYSISSFTFANDDGKDGK